MADLNDLLKSKKVNSFKRKKKARPWTVSKDSSAPQEEVKESETPEKSKSTSQPASAEVQRPSQPSKTNQDNVAKGLPSEDVSASSEERALAETNSSKAKPIASAKNKTSAKIDNKKDNKSKKSSSAKTEDKVIDQQLEASATSPRQEVPTADVGIPNSDMDHSTESAKLIDNKKITAKGPVDSEKDNKKITNISTADERIDNKKITANRQQIDNKQVTNRYQKFEPKLSNNNELSLEKDNKKITDISAADNEIVNKKITTQGTDKLVIDNKKTTAKEALDSKTDNKKITGNPSDVSPSKIHNRQQIDNKKITEVSLSKEIGNKKITRISSDFQPVNIESSIIDNKKITSRPVIDNKLVTNEYQTDSKQVTSGYQTDSTEITNEYQLDNYTDNNWITNLEVDTLVGHELKLLLIIFTDCKNSGSLVTPALNNESLRVRLETSAQVTKMVVHRLIKKGFVKRVDSKKGRGGWTKFGISRQVYQQLLLGERDNKWVSEQITERITNEPSKLEVKNFKSSNSTSSESGIYDDYDQIDITPLEGLGISQKQIRDIKNQKLNLTRNQLESLIEKFAAYANSSGAKIYRPAGLFVKMAQEFAKGEDPLPHIDTSADEEIKALKQRLLAEKAEREKERAEIQELLFEQWWDSASREDKTSLVPEGFAKGEIYRMSVKAKWVEEIWPGMPESQLFKSKN